MFTPDGSRVVTLVCEQTTEFTCNESIHVWDLNGNQLVELRPEDGVSDLTVSPDNQQLIVTGYRDVPKIWDMNTGVELGPLQGTQTAADNAQFSPDGTRLLTSIPTSAAEGGGLHLLNASDGKEIARFDAGYGHFSTDGKRLVLGGFGQSTTVWDIAAAKQIASVKNLPGPSGHAQFSPDGKWILDPSYDITRIWDASTGEILFQVKGDSFTLPSFSADGTRIITSDRDGTALIWTAALDEGAAEFDYYDQNARAEISPDKARLLTSGCIQNGTTGCTEALARIRNVTDGGLTTTLRWQDDTSIDVLFSPTGDRLLTIGCTEFNTFGSCANASVRLWDVLGGNQLARLDKQGFFVDTYWPNDDPLLLIQHCPQSPQTDSCSDWVVEVWDIPSGEERVRLEGNTGRVQGAKYANDGTRIVTASNDGTVRTWDAASGKMLSMWKAHAVGVWRARFLHGHSLVLTNGCESLRGNGMQCQSVGYKLWNANTGAVVAKLKGGSVDTIAYVSPNEEWIAIEGPDNLLLYKARAGEHYATLERTSSIETAVFNADNTHLLTASTDGTARIWDLATAKELVRFRGHTGSIISADFSFDESLVVTTSGDGTVRIWDARTSAERAVLRSGIGDFVSATILPGNKYVLVGVGDDDRTFSRLFLVQPDDIVALARSRNFHQFTCAERETFLHEREACANATSTP